jgi:hypothetical protein
MRKIYLLAFLLQFFIPHFAEAQFFGATRIALDKKKNYSLFSGFQNSIRFNDSTIYAEPGYIYPWRKQFLAKCDSDRNLIWHRVFDDLWLGGIRDAQLASDSRGNTYFACLLSSYLWLDDTLLVSGGSGYDSARLLLVKYDPVGRVDWYRRSSVVALMNSNIGLGTDSSDNVFVSYNFYPGVTFGGDTLRETLTYNGTCIAKFDSAGNEQWLKGLSGSKRNYDFCVSQAGVTQMAGTASSLQGFGPITFFIPGGAAPSLSVCDAAGTPYWQANFTGAANTHKAVSVGPNERPVVAGKYYDSVGFTSLPTFTTSDSASYLASYNMDGIERWAKRVDGLDIENVGVTSVNDIFLVGNITDPVVVIDTSHLAVSGAQGVVARLDSNGNFICNFNFSNFSVEASSVGPADEFIICGRGSTIYGGGYPDTQPVFVGDTMYAASEACLFLVSIGGNCELKSIDSLTNFYLAEEKVMEQSRRSNLLVYPNPVDNSLCVRIEAVSFSSAALNIRDARGKVVRTMETKSKDVEVDVSMLSPGLYVVECVSGTERVVEKFIKQ